ncbi:major facilitator superfamily [Talaromyces proteolyticus]|uniref:Major facilitator superfamily n=1 Tax=Talaromyces proteolyticus TaxID=1131652 RepID=A0AAD4PW84_9EURO|nr:major facilitator superfamily [Talaromyces proteolyticus]KAH8694282.1 major facilitator superfamily [Talaromyces proteolyticus]
MDDSDDSSVLEAQITRTDSIKSQVQSFSRTHEFFFIAVVCLAQFMTQAALGACLSPLTIIGDNLHVSDPGILSWLIAGYSLTAGTFILFFGRCGDLFGYRTMFILGFFWFSLWSMVAGLSVYSNYMLFIFARALQGLGPAMLFPNALALLGSTYPPGMKKRMVFSLFGGMAPSGAVVGAVFAALLSEQAWWPWTFWCMAIYCLILAIAAVAVLPFTHSVPKHLQARDMFIELDVIGAVLGVAGLVLINIAWNQAPVVGWSTAYVYVLLIVGALLLVGFIFYEMKLAPKPLIPFHALNPDVSFILGCVACGWASFGIWIFYLWRFLEKIRGLTPLLVSAQFVPAAPSGLTAAFVTGFLMSKMRPGWIMLFAMTGFTVGSILFAISPIDQTYWALTFVCILIMPWGMDMSFPAATVILSDAVGRRHQGIAASLVTTVVNYSISIGLGFAGTVEVHVNSGGQTFNDTLKGYRGASYMGIGLGVLGIVLSLVYLVKSARRPSLVK